LFAKFHRFISQSILVAQRYDFLGKSGWNRGTMCQYANMPIESEFDREMAAMVCAPASSAGKKRR